ncbi:MAG: hypothetical protein GY820_32675 [Gammaproteobacteria bacterium]|nr:hypothetical protein [Gammaproteobacteria bacterium]
MMPSNSSLYVCMYHFVKSFPKFVQGLGEEAAGVTPPGPISWNCWACQEDRIHFYQQNIPCYSPDHGSGSIFVPARVSIRDTRTNVKKQALIGRHFQPLDLAYI